MTLIKDKSISGFSYYMNGESLLVEIPFITKKGHGGTGTFYVTHWGMRPTLKENWSCSDIEWQNVDKSHSGGLSREYQARLLRFDIDWTVEDPAKFKGGNVVAGEVEKDNYGTSNPKTYFDNIVLRGDQLAPVHIDVKHHHFIGGLSSSLSSSYWGGFSDGQRKWLRETFFSPLEELVEQNEELLMGQTYARIVDHMIEQREEAEKSLAETQKRGNDILQSLIKNTPQLEINEDIQHLAI